MGYQGRIWSQVFVIGSFCVWLTIARMREPISSDRFIVDVCMSFIEAVIAWFLGLAYDKMRYYARFDIITGIYNRHFAMKTMPRLLARVQKKGDACSLFVLDGNDLKRLNDTFGHDLGDKAIQEIAATLRRVMPRGGSIVRMGGDEFLCILPGMSAAHASDFAEILASSVRESTKGKEYAITVSIGYAVCPPDGSDFHELLKVADHRMYANKGYMYQNDESASQ